MRISVRGRDMVGQTLAFFTVQDDSMGVEHRVQADLAGRMQCTCMMPRWCEHIMHILSQACGWDTELDSLEQRQQCLNPASLQRVHAYAARPASPIYNAMELFTPPRRGVDRSPVSTPSSTLLSSPDTPLIDYTTGVVVSPPATMVRAAYSMPPLNLRPLSFPVLTPAVTPQVEPTARARNIHPMRIRQLFSRRSPARMPPLSIGRLRLFTPIPTQLRNDECPVCYEGLDTASTRCCASCKHGFHAPCIHTWLAQRNTCPICRDILI